MLWIRNFLFSIVSRLSPVSAGVYSGVIVFCSCLVCAITLNFAAVGALKEAVRMNLVRSAAQAASIIDGDQHRRFLEPSQEHSEQYRQAIAPLKRMLASTDDLAFVYTCVLVDGQVRFVLDPTPAGDSDRDGVDDKSHIMEPYEDATPAMVQALRQGKTAVDDKPTADKWGSFISGYAPFFDSQGRMAGIVGVDLRAEGYLNRLARIRAASALSVFVALVLSCIIGIGAGLMRRTVIQAEAKHKMDQSKTEIIERLVRASEYRDDDTGQHAVRMAKYCEALARSIGMSEGDCSMLREAAPMHDVGKIGIPDQILHKKGKLTPEEFEVIKTHTVMGANLLAGSEYELLKLAEVIALTHHERWDGSGYPRGLAGEDIPLVGRICTVCDIFDALTSSRPYKEAWTFERATDMILSLSARELDPRLVDAFMAILPEIRTIRGSQDEGKADCLPLAA